MSKPVLYASSETNFNHLGLGVLKDAMKATVSEERNGSFYFEMIYPVSGALINELKNDRIIKADAGHELKQQRFKIKKISKAIKGKITVYAEHVSYITSELAIKPEIFLNGTANNALTLWKNAIVDDNPLVVDSDIQTTSSTSLTIKDVKNAREVLGGVDGSILDKWGGEYKFDNYHISLKKQRGQTANILISYGRNLTDFEQEESIMNTYTSVYPYMTYSDDKQVEHLVTIDELYIDSSYVNNYQNRKILIVDFSNEFDSSSNIALNKIKDKLKALATTYIKNNDVGVPKVSMSLSFLDLSKTLDYKDLQTLEQVNLCDTVPVKFEKLGINTTAKVVSVTWNVLTDSYDQIEIGDIRSSLSNVINNTEKTAQEAQKNSNIALTAANGKNTIFYGNWENPPGPNAKLVGDGWFETDGEYENYYVWDGTIWKFVMSTRKNEEIEKMATSAQADATEAKTIANKSVDDANQAILNANLANSNLATFKDETNAKVVAINANLNGLQTQVTNKAEQSQVTQLSNQISSLVSSSVKNILVNSDFRYNETSWNDLSNLGIYSLSDNDKNLLGNQGMQKFVICALDRFNSYGIYPFQTISDPNKFQGKKIRASVWYRTEGDYVADTAGIYLSVTNNGKKILFNNNAGENVIVKSENWVRYSFLVDLKDMNNITEMNLKFFFARQNWAGKILMTGVMLTEDGNQYDWSYDIVRNAAYAQITQLANDINLRVKQGDVMSQINIEAGRTLIDTKLLVLSADTVKFTGNAFIPGATIKEISADKINTGTLNAASVNIINLNVNKLTGDMANFVKTYWNNINQYISIDNAGLRIGANASQSNIMLNNVGLYKYDPASGNPIFSITHMGDKKFDGILGIRRGYSFAISAKVNAGESDQNYYNMMRFTVDAAGNRYVESFDPLTCRDDIYLNLQNGTGLKSIRFTIGNVWCVGFITTNSQSGIAFASDGNVLTKKKNGAWTVL